MHAKAHVQTPYACVSRLPRPLARPVILSKRVLGPPQHRHVGRLPAPRKALQVCAAASFNSGAGKAEFPKGQPDADSDAGKGSETTAAKVAAYIFLWYGFLLWSIHCKRHWLHTHAFIASLTNASCMIPDPMPPSVTFAGMASTFPSTSNQMSPCMPSYVKCFLRVCTCARCHIKAETMLISMQCRSQHLLQHCQQAAAECVPSALLHCHHAAGCAIQHC